MTKFTLPYWYDLHTHLRQGALLAPIIQSQLDMGCAGVLAMPNTKPPAAKVLKSDALNYWSLEEYQNMIRSHGGDAFDTLITPLYLTKDTTPDMIAEGAKSGLLKACKYYPPHGTTGADFGYPFKNYFSNGVFKAMEEHGIVLCIHGEEHGLPGEEYFDRKTNAEEYFYTHNMPKLIEAFPNLKIACEHVTTKVAVDFVKNAGQNVAASITPQHLLYTVGHLLQGLKYHLFCLPLLKYEEDRHALRQAATASNNTQFYAGTDSAAHTVKATDCGCAAGCFTGGIAPQLYAQGFEENGLDLSNADNQKIFENFLCHNGAKFYDLPTPSKTMTLSKAEQTIEMINTPDGQITPLPLGLGQSTIPWTLSR
ncbi:MAG: dihydroorotase [Micavibrio sp.]|nr:dihydroorotase [Micavibrio sp.]